MEKLRRAKSHDQLYHTKKSFGASTGFEGHGKGIKVSMQSTRGGGMINMNREQVYAQTLLPDMERIQPFNGNPTNLSGQCTPKYVEPHVGNDTQYYRVNRYYGNANVTLRRTSSHDQIGTTNTRPDRDHFPWESRQSRYPQPHEDLGQPYYSPIQDSHTSYSPQKLATMPANQQASQAAVWKEPQNASLQEPGRPQAPQTQIRPNSTQIPTKNYGIEWPDEKTINEVERTAREELDSEEKDAAIKCWPQEHHGQPYPHTRSNTIANGLHNAHDAYDLAKSFFEGSLAESAEIAGMTKARKKQLLDSDARARYQRWPHLHVENGG